MIPCLKNVIKTRIQKKIYILETKLQKSGHRKGLIERSKAEGEVIKEPENKKEKENNRSVEVSLSRLRC